MDVTRLLKHDHNRVKELFRRYDAIEDPERRQQLFEDIHGELTVHARLEDELFYPALRKDAREAIAGAVEEHLVVKRLLAELARLTPDHDRFAAKMKLLRDMTLRHIAEEEDAPEGAFAMARRHLTRPQLDELGRRMEARRGALTSSWVNVAAEWLRSLVPEL